jgi:uncharacterized membrane protein YqjE
MADTHTHGTSSDQSIPELTRQLSEQTTRLVRQEVELAKAELGEKAKTAGIGAGMFGAAGIVGLFALGALTAAAILALDSAMAGWLAALIVAVVYGAVAAVLAMQGKQEVLSLTGRTRVQRATPPVPKQALDSTKEDVQWTKERVKATRS